MANEGRATAGDLAHMLKDAVGPEAIMRCYGPFTFSEDKPFMTADALVEILMEYKDNEFVGWDVDQAGTIRDHEGKTVAEVMTAESIVGVLNRAK